MSNKEAAPQHTEPAKEAEHKNEATKASSSWLGYKLDRWLGHGARTTIGESIIYGGVTITTAGILNTLRYPASIILRPTELAVAATGLGGLITAAGAWAEWKMGMQHAKSKLEKRAFWLSKIGQVAAPIVALSNPLIATGLYSAGVAMAFRGMAHRPEAVKPGAH